MKDKTLIKISKETWEALNKRKQMGESFDQLIQRILLEFPEVRK